MLLTTSGFTDTAPSHTVIWNQTDTSGSRGHCLCISVQRTVRDPVIVCLLSAGSALLRPDTLTRFISPSQQCTRCVAVYTLHNLLPTPLQEVGEYNWLFYECHSRQSVVPGKPGPACCMYMIGYFVVKCCMIPSPPSLLPLSSLPPSLLLPPLSLTIPLSLYVYM